MDNGCHRIVPSFALFTKPLGTRKANSDVLKSSDAGALSASIRTSPSFDRLPA